MPEGHSLRRLALAFERWFVGSRCTTSSPQGRFEAGATRLDGMTMTGAQSVGKHLFLRFEVPGHADGPVWLHVHLGLYGSWRFYGRPGMSVPASIGAPRMPDLAYSGDSGVGVTSVNGEVAELEESASSGLEIKGPGGDRGGDAFRLEITSEDSDGDGEEPSSDEGTWLPPPPRGAVRLRIRTESAAADLTGPTQCEVIDAAGVEAVLGRLGPDPLDADTDPRLLREEFVRRVRASRRPVGELLMDQSVSAGVGNIYRAEALFRQGISPHRRGTNVSVKRLRALWDDLTVLLSNGVAEGHIRTVDPQLVNGEITAVDDEAEKWFVYKRDGHPCLVCGAPIRTQMMQGRNLYWCAVCQR